MYKLLRTCNPRHVQNDDRPSKKKYPNLFKLSVHFLACASSENSLIPFRVLRLQELSWAFYFKNNSVFLACTEKISWLRNVISKDDKTNVPNGKGERKAETNAAQTVARSNKTVQWKYDWLQFEQTRSCLPLWIFTSVPSPFR